MLNLDKLAKGADKLAKGAKEGLQKVEQHSGEAGDAVKSALQGVKTAEKLANLSGKVPEPALAALRKLVEEAEKLAGAATEKNEALEACIQKAKALLSGGDASADKVAALTAELGALLKGAKGASDGAKPEPAKPAGEGAGRNAAPTRAQAAAPAPAPAAKTVDFSDVEAGAYYYDAVQWAVQKGVASGTSDTTFSPDQTCTRAQTISFLWRAAGSPEPKSGNNPFTDVADGAYYQKAALWAAERGIVSGAEFLPDTPVTRGQLSAFLYRDAGSPAVKNDPGFTDVPKDAYFCQAVAWVAEQGITSGTGEHTFSPDTVCTRGQIVTFLYRARK